MTVQYLLTWFFNAFLSDSLILLAMLLKDPYYKDLFKGISVWGSCCAFAYVLINVFQSRYRNILSLVSVSFNWRGGKKKNQHDWVLGEMVSFYSWAFEISRQFKREREVTVNEAAKRRRYGWKIPAKRHVETVLGDFSYVWIWIKWTKINRRLFYSLQWFYY